MKLRIYYSGQQSDTKRQLPEEIVPPANIMISYYCALKYRREEKRLRGLCRIRKQK